MTDDRPTPRYGELAPEGWAWSPPGADGESPGTPREGTTPRGETGTNASPQAPPGKADPDAARRAVHSRPVLRNDIVSTVLLIALGLMLTASSVPGLFDLRNTIAMFYERQGLGSYGGGSTANVVGAIAGFLHIVIMLGVIGLSARLIAQRRRAVLVPLLGGALATIVMFTCIVMALVSDPALMSTIGTSN